MAVKGKKKRSLENHDKSGKAVELSKPSPIKKPKLDKQQPTNTDEIKKSPQKTGKLGKKPTQAIATPTIAAKDSTVVVAKTNNGDTPEKLEKKSKKSLERQRANRKKFGQYKPENITLPASELEKKIAAIESQETISKTARRRLAVFKKKLKILQGTYEPPAVSMAKKTNAEKKQLRREKAALKKSENGDAVTETNVKVVKQAQVKGDKSKKNANKKVIQKKIKTTKPETMEEDDDIDIEGDEDNDSDVEEDEDEVDVDNEVDEEVEDDDSDVDVEKDDQDEEDGNETDEDLNIDIESAKQGPKPPGKKTGANVPVKVTQSPKEDSQKKRFVLFVGNLPYSITVDELKQHFLTKVDHVVSVRIPPGKNKAPRGIAYVEFTNNIDYEKGLSLHHSIISGRQINVQYSAGGSKTVNKRPEIIAKNKKLHAMRKQGKLAGSVKESQKRNARRNKPKQ